MQRISSIAACRELGSLAVCSPGVCAWKKAPTCSKLPAVHRYWARGCVRPARPFSRESGAPDRRLCRRGFVFAGQSHRLFSSKPGAEDPSSSGAAGVSVVGIPDPITWIRCRVIMYLIKLYFELDMNSVEFQMGVKQALVHVSSMMSTGCYYKLVGIVSREMIDYVEEKCKVLTITQRQQLAVQMDDIVFVLPEDVSVVFDKYGRKFCHVVMRFWVLSTHEGPDDPEGAKIFKVDSSTDGGPPRKIATAVYDSDCQQAGKQRRLTAQRSKDKEFHRELTMGASPDWTVTTVWHWHWKAAESL